MTGIFVMLFIRKGYVFLLLSAEGKFQVCMEIAGLWLFVFVSDQDPGSLLWEGFH